MDKFHLVLVLFSFLSITACVKWIPSYARTCFGAGTWFASTQFGINSCGYSKITVELYSLQQHWLVRPRPPEANINKVAPWELLRCHDIDLILENKYLKTYYLHKGEYRAIPRTCNNVTTEYNSTGKMWCRIFGTHARGNQPLYIWGETFLAVDLDDSQKAEVRMSKWSQNQWKKNYFVFKVDKACSPVLFHSKDLMHAFFGEDANKCPIKAGHRIIPNHTAEFVFPHFPVMPYGRWLFTIAVLKGQETVGVSVSELDIVPKI